MSVSGPEGFDFEEYNREGERWGAAWANANVGVNCHPSEKLWYGTSGSVYHGLSKAIEKRIRKVFGEDISDEAIVRIFRMKCELVYALSRSSATTSEYNDLLAAVEKMLGPTIVEAIGDQYR